MSSGNSLTQSDLTKSHLADYYLKDAGDILGVSMHELEDFINPTPKKSQHSTLSHGSSHQQ